MIAHYAHVPTPRAPPTPPYSSVHPLTPPAEEMVEDVEMTSSTAMVAGKPPLMPSDAPHLVDWLDFTRARSAHFIAEKTCEMICYLWHATPPPLPASSSSTNPYPSPNNSPPSSALTYSANPTPATSAHQLHVYPEFVSFVQKILETTQVSQSVIVLSLHYIWKFKHRTRLVGPSGSEYRIAVGGLMMANKFLDDNTYTNKTWSEVSGIPLIDVNNMEVEFLKGVDFNLYVDKATYESWLHLLKGLVMAKEKDLWRARGGQRRYGARRPNHHAANHQVASSHHTPSGRARHYRAGVPSRELQPQQTTTQQQHRRQGSRARSTSPVSRSSFPHYQLPPLQPPQSQPQTQLPPPLQSQPSRSSTQYDASSSAAYNYKPVSYNYSPSPAPSSLKRSAATAFSPTSASFSQVPLKRSGVETSLPPITSAISAMPSLSTAAVSNTVNDAPVSAVALQRPGITLQIPQCAPRSQNSGSGSSPMDGLPIHGFAKMNIDSSSSYTANSLSSALGPMPSERERELEYERERERERERELELERERERERERQRQREVYRMSTLVQPYHYSMEEQKKTSVPKHLYFYTLACSPLEDGPSRATSPVYNHSQTQPPAHVQPQYRHRVEEVDHTYTDEDTNMDIERQVERERERQLEYERQRELEIERIRQRELEEREREREERERELVLEREREEREREKERERERLRKARLRVHKPPPPSTIRYSDYAYMPYVASNMGGHFNAPTPASQQPPPPSSTAHSTYRSQPAPPAATMQSHPHPAPAPAPISTRLPGPADIIAQTQSARTSPVFSHGHGQGYGYPSQYHHNSPSYAPPPATTTTTTTGKHFDAVRFEVERTQGQQQQAPQATSRPSTASYFTPGSAPAPVPAPVSSTLTSAATVKRANPYPQLSPPTPVTSTRTSPVAGVLGVEPQQATSGCRGACCVQPPPPPPNTATTPGYSSLAGATTYTPPTAISKVPSLGGYGGYERGSVSAYTSPAMPAYSHHTYHQSPSAARQTYSYSTPQHPNNTTSTAHLSAKEREELAYAQATAQVHAVNKQHRQQAQAQALASPVESAGSRNSSPQGVPSMPFANAGPPGVCQSMYSPGTNTTISSAGGAGGEYVQGGYAGYGYAGYGQRQEGRWGGSYVGRY